MRARGFPPPPRLLICLQLIVFFTPSLNQSIKKVTIIIKGRMKYSLLTFKNDLYMHIIKVTVKCLLPLTRDPTVAATRILRWLVITKKRQHVLSRRESSRGCLCFCNLIPGFKTKIKLKSFMEYFNRIRNNSNLGIFHH